MGIIIRCLDSVFENTVGIADYPIIPQLKNLYFLGGTLDKTLYDASGNGNNGKKVGDFTVESNYAQFSTAATSNFIEAQPATLECTKMYGVALVRKNGSRGVITANTSSSGFAFATNRILYKGASWKDHVSQGAIPADEYFYPVMWRLDEIGCGIYRLNENGSGLIAAAEYTDNTPVIITQNDVVCIGGMKGSFSATGTADIAVAAYYEGEVSTSNLVDALNFVREYGMRKGLDVK